MVGEGRFCTSVQPLLGHFSFETMSNVCLQVTCDDITTKASSKMSDHVESTFCLFFCLAMIDRYIRQIGQICQIFQLSLNFSVKKES